MTARKLRGFIFLFVFASAANAQVPTGTISGKVRDQQGLAIPGATITATSPNLQGERTVVSSESGDYVIPLLPPGDYTVTVERSGFQTVKRTMAVAGTQVVAMDLTLTLGGLNEEVTVSSTAAPFTETATIATGYRQELMETLPSSRTLAAAVLLAPNVHATGPNNTNGADGSIAIAGAMSFDSLYMVNGVAVTENVRGQPFTLFIEDAIQETTVSTGGISAEYGRFGGGLVNAITKSGGNSFSGSYRQSFNNDNWRTVSPFPGETKLDKVVPTYEYTLGGPILRNNLWFFTAGRFQKQEQARQTVATVIPYAFGTDEKRFEGKLTYSLDDSQTIRGSFAKIQTDVINNNFQNVMDVRSLYTQKQPQDLLSLNYNRIVGTRLAIEGQYSNRHFAIEDTGSPYHDLIGGTLLIDRTRGSGGTGFRYWSPTFCTCNDDERDNSEFLVKATYFTSSSRFGSHNVVFGYDTFNDHRVANNYQSGSNYRILGTSTVIRGTDVYPVFLTSGSLPTLIQWDDVALPSDGTDLRVHSGFVNDTWRWSRGVTLSLGLRYDRNDAEDASGKFISNSSHWSPRLGVTWDPRNDGRWAVTASVAKYASSLATAVAENSPAGNASTYQYAYQGPEINADPNAPLVTSDIAIQTVFDWFNANGGTNRPTTLAQILGVNQIIGDSLKSPYSLEYSGGVSRTIGTRGTVRFDYVFRDYHDFYSVRTDLTTGQVTNSAGTLFDVSVVENTDDMKRRYQSGAAQFTYRLGSGTNIGGSYTLSRLWGNIDGENAASGPLQARLFDYPEYREARWNVREGNLYGDQRHRARIWGTYSVPMSEKAGTLDFSLLYAAASGTPYVLGGATSAAPGEAVGQLQSSTVLSYVNNPGYVRPLGNTTTVEYIFFPRDEYRTETQHRTDFSVNYTHSVVGSAEAFFHAEVLNIFNQSQLCGCGGTVFNNGGGNDIRTINRSVRVLQPFNPFTETPVEGVHWARGTATAPFGTPANRFAYTSPRTFRFSAGMRF
jgi:Carboxypeptidase regulatory-like domain/TonB-dependent Receptor Plug Domain